jgi:hypothetical protein
LPFDRLRASGGVLKSFDFSVHAELVETSNTIWATARVDLTPLSLNSPFSHNKLQKDSQKDNDYQPEIFANSPGCFCSFILNPESRWRGY